MTIKQFLHISAISLGLMDSGSVLAQGGLTQMRKEQQQVQQREKQKEDVGQDDFRSRVQMRMRTMSQEERALMNDLSVNGQQRLEAENAVQNNRAHGMGHAGGMEGSRFGRGYESRQMQQNSAATGVSPMGAAGGSAAGMGVPGGGSGGGGGRGR